MKHPSLFDQVDNRAYQRRANRTCDKTHYSRYPHVSGDVFSFVPAEGLLSIVNGFHKGDFFQSFDPPHSQAMIIGLAFQDINKFVVATRDFGFGRLNSCSAGEQDTRLLGVIPLTLKRDGQPIASRGRIRRKNFRDFFKFRFLIELVFDFWNLNIDRSERLFRNRYEKCIQRVSVTEIQGRTTL